MQEERDLGAQREPAPDRGCGGTDERAGRADAVHRRRRYGLRTKPPGTLALRLPATTEAFFDGREAR